MSIMPLWKHEKTQRALAGLGSAVPAAAVDQVVQIFRKGLIKCKYIAQSLHAIVACLECLVGQ